MDVAKQWCREFYRLRDKIFYNTKEVNNFEDYPFVVDQEKEKVITALTRFSPKDYVFLKETEKVINP
jgi:hypothetical protein